MSADTFRGEKPMRLTIIALGCALTLLPAIPPATTNAASAATNVRYYYHNGSRYRYHWRGGYYNYRWHGRYYRSRYRCGADWCYR
jgi:hypothetical protein